MVHIAKSQCNLCWTCVMVCPTGALKYEDAGLTVSPALCNDCGTCVAACPVGAITSTAVAVVRQEIATLPASPAPSAAQPPVRNSLAAGLGGVVKDVILPRLLDAVVDRAANRLSIGSAGADRVRSVQSLPPAGAGVAHRRRSRCRRP